MIVALLKRVNPTGLFITAEWDDDGANLEVRWRAWTCIIPKGVRDYVTDEILAPVVKSVLREAKAEHNGCA